MNDLDPVIKEVPAGSRPERPHQKIVIFNVRTGRFLGHHRRVFLVSSSESGAVAERRDMSVTVGILAGSYEVRLDYRVQCPPGREQDAVEALAAGGNLQARLEDLLGAWVRAFVQEQEAQLLSESEGLVVDLERHLAERAAAETALSLTARVRLEEPRSLRPRTFGPCHLQVRARDADLEVDLEIEVELVVDPDERPLAWETAGRLDGFVSRIPEVLAAHTCKDLTLQQLYAERDSTVVRFFETVLNELLVPVGRRVERLRLSGGPQIPSLVAVDEVEWHQDLSVRDHPQVVTMAVQAVLALTDLGSYVRAGRPALQGWFPAVMERLAKLHLSRLGYRELSVLAASRQQAVREAVVERAAEIGYAATARIALHGLDSGALEPHHLSEIFSCRVEGYGKAVQVKAEMILQVDQPEVYLARGCPALEAWAREQVRNMVGDYLFGVRYTDLCIDLDEHKAEIEERVKQAAEKLGIGVKQLTTFTDLLLERLRKGLEIRLEGDFPTSHSSVAVGLELKAEIRILELERLRDTLDKYPELVEHMETTVRRHLAQKLREMNPGVFYTEFQKPTPTDGPPVHRQIEDLAREILEKDFHAEVLDISCRQQKTELSELWEELSHTLHPFAVTVEGLQGNPDLRFHGTIRVEGIAGSDGWNTFRQMTPKPEELTRRVVEHLNAHLVDARFEDLFHGSNNQLREKVQASLSKQVATDFGLSVTLSTWRREALEIERKAARRREELWSAGLESAEELRRHFAKLRKERFDLIASGLDDDGRVEDLQERIRRLEEEKSRLLQRHSVQPLPLGSSNRPVSTSSPGSKSAGTSDESESGGAKTGMGTPSDREISAWLDERLEGVEHGLEVGTVYHLNFKVGEAVAWNLLEGETLVAGGEVPAEGLDLEWVVHSRDVEMLPGPGVEITAEMVEGDPAWTASFLLLVPETGESQVRTLAVRPRRAGDNRLAVVLLSRSTDRFHGRPLREVYRQLALCLTVVDERLTAATSEPLTITGDVILATAGHLNLGTPHKWATPPGKLSLFVFSGTVHVCGDVLRGSAIEERNQVVPWHGLPARVEGPMKNVRSSAERLRARWESYFNDIDPVDLEQRLRQPFKPADWRALSDDSSDAHRQSWQQVAVSSELRDLAHDGYALYEAFFPPGCDLRSWLDELPLGHRLDLTWLPGGGADWIPHVPWGLMYRRPAPAAGSAVDPMEFLGLGFRLAYTSHEVAQPSKALGALGRNNPAFLLYWGNDPDDETGTEAAWQRQRWEDWPNRLLVPAGGASPAARQELLEALDDPQPKPVTMLYLYCQASVGQGNDPVLRFSRELSGRDEVRRTDLPQSPLADGPLVFANACTTAAAGAYMTNLLEESFFKRGCRAFLGTETKVPIAFGSRFAAVFFHFFFRQADPAVPLAAGEAVALTRLFLWNRYRNIGGLFYTYVNQYELFMADDAELQALRS